MRYLDSKRDRDVLEAVIATITSVKSVVSIKSTKFKGSVSKHCATLDSTLQSFKEINQSCQTVRNNMTISQQHNKVQREKEKIKNEQLRWVLKEGEESLQYCAKVMQTKFGEFRSLFSQIFEGNFAKFTAKRFFERNFKENIA